jgi:hypothetical protein
LNKLLFMIRLVDPFAASISVHVLYNFLYDQEDHSPYYSPVIYQVDIFFKTYCLIV